MTSPQQTTTRSTNDSVTEPTGRRRRALATVARKRDDHTLDSGDIGDLVAAYMDGHVDDSLMSAFLMAAVIRGLRPEETRALCQAMIDSGRRLTYPDLRRPLVDKHSTGGVGDKTSLLIAPMLAAVGAGVPMMSGRGLGHTGGTLDKLESIPGFRVDLDAGHIARQLAGVGAVICAANKDLAPADAKLYALRDATATVPGLGLIAASIMSKKIAEGTDALVLDVKCGTGAFLPDAADARRLAETMVDLGNSAGVRTRALITDMSSPLGDAVGNSLEIQEIVAALDGHGPRDLLDLSIAIARDMAELAGIDDDPAETLRDGRARETWNRMVRAQGGNPDAPVPIAHHQHQVCARSDGYVTGVDSRRVGELVVSLGGGRTRPGEAIDHRVGVVIPTKPGRRVHIGETVAVVYAASDVDAKRAAAELGDIITISDRPVAPVPLIRERIG